MKQVAIIGAGLAGLSTAYHLGKRHNNNYIVFEKEGTVGGLCRTVNSKGFLFDYTGHLLHLKKDYTKKLVGRLLKGKLRKIYRNSWIFSKGVYTRYPFQENTYGLPPETVRECVTGFIKSFRSRKKSAKNQSFYDWILEHFGVGIAKHFMVPYNTKMWARHPEELTTLWLGGYIPKPTIREVADGALFDRKSGLGYNAFFYYPEKGGIQVLPDALASACGNLKLNTVVTGIDTKKRKVFFSGKGAGASGEACYDALVSSVPLREFILKIVRNVPEKVRKAARGLRYNSVLNINFGIGRKRISDRHWIYFPEDEFIFYRAGFHMNFSGRLVPSGTSSIYTETAYKPGDRPKILNNRKNIIKKVKKDLIRAGVLNNRDKALVTRVFDIEYAYVIHDKNYETNIKIIRDFLEKNNIHAIGRYGNWEYSAMEEAILAGRDTAKRIGSN